VGEGAGRGENNILGEGIPKEEVSEGVWEGFYVFVELEAQSEVEEVGGECIDGLVEFVAKT
jgi:hypothetical protein